MLTGYADTSLQHEVLLNALGYFVKNQLAKTALIGLLVLEIFCTPLAQAQSTSQIIDEIFKLESRNDPKCYATASRLEDFMFGTPLAFEARSKKNLLQRDFVRTLWQLASHQGTALSNAQLDKADIRRATESFFATEVNTGQHFELTFADGQVVVINRVDKRQYSSIAYSLRALLSVQQEALVSPPSIPLKPLSPNAITTLQDSADLYTLSVLKVADALARRNNEPEISADLLARVWSDLKPSNSETVGQAAGIQSGDNTDILGGNDLTNLTREIIDQKVAAYAEYNAISNPLFIRNLQVYFAKRRWPADADDARRLRQQFTEVLIGKAGELYLGAQALASGAGEPLIREVHVQEYSQSVLPHFANQYEDIIFFPSLPIAEQITIEAYDIDAFRDSGLHWRYLQYALGDSEAIDLQADPFALELLTESIANWGVLILRIAGRVSIEEARDRLASKDIAEAMTEISNLSRKNHAATVSTTANDIATSIQSAPPGASASSSDIYFEDVTEVAGVSFQHKSSDWLSRRLRTYIQKDEQTGIITIPPAFGGSGAAAGDIDNDGDQDILLLSGLGNGLFINDGTGHFTQEAKRRGVDWRRQDGRAGEPRQPLIADIDNDGHQDIVITYVNDSHRIYRNRGNGTFEDVTTRAKLGGVGLVGGPATLVDANNDGLLDIYITYFGHYLEGILPTLARRNTNGLANQLFINKGGFEFENLTQQAGLGNEGWGQAVTHTDFSGDGLQDIIAGNDFGVNGYYRNNGDGTFTDVSHQLGTDKPSYTMGIGISDLNRDGIPDVYISNIVTMNKDQKYVLPSAETPAVFGPESLANLRVIEANDLFLSQQSGSGLLFNYEMSDAVQRGYAETGWSWGAEFFDADHDGDDDLYVLNGMNEFHVYSSENPYYTDPFSEENKSVYMPVSQKEHNVFFRNERGSLNTYTEAAGLGDFSNGRALLKVDIDDDGDLDLVINNYHGPARVLQNQSQAGLSTLIRLQGDPASGVNSDAIGAQVTAHMKDGSKIWRELRSSGGYMSAQPKNLHIGQPAHDIDRLVLTWPNAEKTIVEGPFSGSRIFIKYDQ